MLHSGIENIGIINNGNDSVANWPIFLPQNAKVAPENSQRPRKSAAEFYAEFPKKWQKRGRIFW
jgi:hypothetical protein